MKRAVRSEDVRKHPLRLKIGGLTVVARTHVVAVVGNLLGIAPAWLVWPHSLMLRYALLLRLCSSVLSNFVPTYTHCSLAKVSFPSCGSDMVVMAGGRCLDKCSCHRSFSHLFFFYRILTICV